MKTFRFLVCAAGAALLSALSAQATPYASEITNNSGTIQFYLNEQPDSVVVTFEDHSTLNLPSPAVGQNSFALGTHTSYAIAVSKVGSGSPTLISSDTNTYSLWNSPRGLGVNANPANGSLFGRIYVANSSAGAKGKGLYILNADQSSEAGGTTGLTTGNWQASSSSPYRLSVADDGEVYVADFTAAGATVWQFDPDFIKFTNQVLGGLGNTAGIAAGIHGEFFGEPVVTGSIAGGNMVLWTADDTMAVDAAGANTTLGYNTAAGDFNNLNRYSIGAGPLPWTNAPDLAINSCIPSIATLDFDVDIGRRTGNIYDMNYRLNWAAPCLQVFDPTGMNLLWDSLTSDGGTLGSGPDWFNPQSFTAYTNINLIGTATTYGTGNFAAYAMKVSPDEKFVAVALVNNPVFVMNLTNGVPDPATLTIIPNAPNTGGYENVRALCWDAADDVYVASSGQGLLRIYSLGLTTTCVTSNDATGLNGSFSVATPNVQASVVATTPLASQAGGSFNYPAPQPAVFTISLNAAQTVPVNIAFTLGGTATNGVNYTSSASGAVNFPAGATFETVTITPTVDPVSGPSLSVTLSLKSGASYSAVSPAAATASIANTGPQVLDVGDITFPTMYRGTPRDYVGFQILRWGDTNVAFTIPASAFSYTGTAVKGTDYTNPVPNVPVNAGDTVETATNGGPVSSAYPFTYVGNQSIIIAMSAGSSVESVPFTIGPTVSATMTLLDNAYPPETVIWSDPLTNANDTGWNLAFGSVATNTVLSPNYVSVPGGGSTADTDYDVEFGYTLAGDPLIGQNPPSGQTNALKVTVNKIPGITYFNGTSTITGASGGVSIYPALAQGVPMSFAGNFALRFSELTYQDTGSLATEFTQWGINHYGTNANWWAGAANGGFGNTNIDGVWYSLTCEQGGASFGDVLEFAGQPLPNAGWTNIGSKSWAAFTAVFKHPPYNSNPNPGGGAFSEGYGNLATLWNDVELKQSNRVVTLSINKTPIYTYTNTTIFQSGDVMLGYCDPFDSIGTFGEAYFSQARVVELGPAITNQPLGGTVAVGGNWTFTVGVVGMAPFTNNWYLGTNLIHTDTSSSPLYTESDSLTVSSVGLNNGGSYTVVVSDASGSTTSAAAMLTVAFPPAITNGPVSITNNQDATVSFAVAASGTTPLTYQWQLNHTKLTNGPSISGSGAIIAGATNATLFVTNIQPADAGSYTVIVSNPYGAATNTALLSVVTATPPSFGAASLSGGNVVMQFSSSDIYDTANSFKLLSSTNLLGPFTNTTAIFTNVSGGFQATVTPNAAAEYFILQHK